MSAVAGAPCGVVRLNQRLGMVCALVASFEDVPPEVFDAGVDVYASSGVTNGGGSFGYVVYVREDQFEKAADALEL